jgi:parvulin-like peptidyl-prolyl isomerase
MIPPRVIFQRVHALGALLLIFAHGASAADSAAKTVGSLGASRRIDFVGNKSFPTESIRRALRMNPGWMDAAHPGAPLDKFIATTRNVLERGYKNGGFPLVKITDARLEGTPPHLVCVIEEGPRYTAREVHVTGAKTVPAEVIIRHLTTKELAKAPWDQTTREAKATFGNVETPATGSSESQMNELMAGNNAQGTAILWEVGQPAPLDDTKAGYTQSDLQAFLAAKGLMQAKLEVNIERNDAARTATLVVRILDEGPLAEVGDIEITGASRDSKEEILKYLGLAKGQRSSTDLVAQIEGKLRRSGRYISHKVTLQPPAPGRAEIHLRLELLEMKEAPKLLQPLSPAQQTLVKCGLWLEDILRSGKEDILMEVIEGEKGHETVSATLINDPKRGWVIASALHPAGSTRSFLLRLRYSVDDFAVLWSRQDGSAARGWRGPKIPFPLQTVSVALKPALDSDGNSFMNFILGAGWNTNLEESLLRFQLEMPPAVFVLWGQTLAPGWQTHDGVAGVVGFRDERKITTFQIEEATGRLKWIEEIYPGTDGMPPHTLRLSVRPGAWDAASKELNDQSAGVPNAYDAKEPWPSWAAFVAQNCFNAGLGLGADPAPAEVHAMTTAIHNLTRDLLAEPLRAIVDTFNLGDDPFSIPYNADDFARAMRPDALLSVVALMMADYFMDETSWPWLLTREMYYLKQGRNDYVEETLRQIREDPHLGPVGCYLVAQTLESVLPEASRKFLELGRTRLSTSDFRSDWELLRDSPLGRQPAMTAMLQRFQKGQQDEVRLLEAVLTLKSELLPAPPANVASLLEKFSGTLRGLRNTPLSEALKTTMDGLWEQSFREQVRKAIEDKLTPKDKDGHAVDPKLVAAIVNGQIITRADVQEAAQAQRQVYSNLPKRTPEQEKALANLDHQALNALVERELVISEFHRLGGNVPPDLVQNNINQIVKENFAGDMAHFITAINKGGMTIERFRELQEKMLIVQYMKQQMTKDLPAPTEAEIRAAQAGMGGAVHSVKISTISLPMSSDGAATKKQAQEILGQIKAGADFAALAKAHSQDSRAQEGGASDWIEVDSLSPELGKAIAALKPGQNSDVVDLGSILMIIRLNEERDVAPIVSRSQLIALAKASKAKDAVDKKLKELRAAANVRILEP